MATEEQKVGASFDPEDAGGSSLFENGRAVITKARVVSFNAKSGESYTNIDVTYKADDRDEFTEHYMLGKVSEWVPSADGKQAIPTRDGGKVWNKSDAFKLTKSLRDAGFPKLGADISVLDGLDVQLNRVTTDGKYTGNDGKERARSILLVVKINTPAADLASGAYQKGGAKTTAKPVAKAKATTAPATPAATEAPAEVDDAYLTEIVLDALAKGPVKKDALKQPIFLRSTKDKRVKEREGLQVRAQDDAFYAGLVEAGLITFDGTTIAAAA